jgi:hypothetical protein
MAGILGLRTEPATNYEDLSIRRISEISEPCLFTEEQKQQQFLAAK